MPWLVTHLASLPNPVRVAWFTRSHGIIPLQCLEVFFAATIYRYCAASEPRAAPATAAARFRFLALDLVIKFSVPPAVAVGGSGVSLAVLILCHAEGLPCEFHHSRNLAVADAAQSVHPTGHPISHSTQFGFSCPPIWSFRFRVFSGLSHRLFCPVRKSRDCGVANFTASARAVVIGLPDVLLCGLLSPSHGEPSRFTISPDFVILCACGVGHIPRAFAALRLLLPPSSPVVRGVGHIAVAAIPPSEFTPPHFFTLAFGFIRPVPVASIVFGVG